MGYGKLNDRRHDCFAQVLVIAIVLPYGMVADIVLRKFRDIFAYYYSHPNGLAPSTTGL